MKYGYRISPNGWFIPQYGKDGKWLDFKMKNLKDTHSPLHQIAITLGKPGNWGSVQYHTRSIGTDKLDEILIFATAIKVSAFLGAANYYFSPKVNKTTELNF